MCPRVRIRGALGDIDSLSNIEMARLREPEVGLRAVLFKESPYYLLGPRMDKYSKLENMKNQSEGYAAVEHPYLPA